MYEVLEMARVIFTAREMTFADAVFPMGTKCRFATAKEAKDFERARATTDTILKKKGWRVVMFHDKLRWMAPEDIKIVKEKPPESVMKATERAMGELNLSLSTQADKNRWWEVMKGLRALDDEQAAIKDRIDDLLEAWDKAHETPGSAGTALVNGLRKIVAVK